MWNITQFMPFNEIRLERNYHIILFSFGWWVNVNYLQSWQKVTFIFSKNPKWEWCTYLKEELISNHITSQQSEKFHDSPLVNLLIKLHCYALLHVYSSHRSTVVHFLSKLNWNYYWLYHHRSSAGRTLQGPWLIRQCWYVVGPTACLRRVSQGPHVWTCDPKKCSPWCQVFPGS